MLTRRLEHGISPLKLQTDYHQAIITLAAQIKAYALFVLTPRQNV